MTRRLYLDIDSAIRAGYAEAFEQFTWPISQQTYDSVAGSFIDFLEETVVSPSLGETEKIELALSIVPIANECFFFAASHMILDTCARTRQEYNFSPNGRYYPALAEYRSGSTTSVSDALLRMQIDRQRGFAAKYIRPHRKRIRRYQLAITSRVKRPRVYQMTNNKLMNEWVSPAYPSLRSLASITGWGLEHIGRQYPVTELSNHIAKNFVRIIAEHEFEINEFLFGYFQQMSAVHLGIARHWRSKSHERFFNTRNSVLLTATAGGFESRLISHVFQRNGLPVLRFSHGGERGLIDDPRWHYSELMFADQYLVHGRTEANQVQNAVARKTSSLTAKNLRVIGVGSKFHQQLRTENSSAVSPGQIQNVMVVPTSFKGEIRPAFVSVGEEITYFEWHLRLLESIRDSDYNVISKRHPKGFMSGTKLFEGYAHREVTDGMFIDLLDQADAFVFDFAGSAFMESLCTNKPVVLVEFPHRTMSTAGHDELASVCALVPSSYDENNRIVSDFREVMKGIKRPVDPVARERFLENYLLSPSEHLSEFTDSLAERS